MTAPIVQHKTCRICKTPKIVPDEFYRISNKARTRVYYLLDCKSCFKNKQRARVLTPEQRTHKAAQARKRRQSPKFKEYQREYKTKNRERLRTNARLWARKKYGLKPREKWTEEKRKACVRNSGLKFKYNITQVDYEAMLDAQGGRCAICNLPPDPNTHPGKLVIDHDHITKRVRGLLCHKHNAGLGLFSDNLALLDKAREYLAQHS